MEFHTFKTTKQLPVRIIVQRRHGILGDSWMVTMTGVEGGHYITEVVAESVTFERAAEIAGDDAELYDTDWNYGDPVVTVGSVRNS